MLVKLTGYKKSPKHVGLLQLQEHFKATKSVEAFFKKKFENNFDSYVIPAYR